MTRSYSYTLEFLPHEKPGQIGPSFWQTLRTAKTLERATDLFNIHKGQNVQNLRIVQHIEHSIKRTWVGQYTEHKIKKVLHKDPDMVIRWTE